MKELSIEEKARAYDKAIEKAKEYFNSPRTCFDIEQLCNIFPELKESEDERIRKELIDFLEYYRLNNVLDSKTISLLTDSVAWLEKQGEHANFLSKIQVGDKVTRNEDGVLVNLSQLNRVAKKDEKQGKNNMGISEATKRKLEFNLNKALEKETSESWNEFLDKQGEQRFEQKFFINDKVVHKATGKIWTIHHYLKDTNSYYVEDNDGLLHHYRESELKLVEQKPDKIFDSSMLKPDPNPYWTLATEYQLANKQKSADRIEPKFHKREWIIFNGLTLYVKEVVKGYYRTISIDGIPNSYDWDIDNVARLWTIQDAKAGDVLSYRDGQWIFIYKGIVTEDTFKYYALLSEKGITVNDAAFSLLASCIIPATKEQCNLLFQKMKKAGYVWDAERKELKKIKQKPAWSEEDKRMFESVLWHLRNSVNNGDTDHSADHLEIWFKSLKDRVQPQSKHEWSEEEIEILDNLVREIELLSHMASMYWKFTDSPETILKFLKSLRPQNKNITSKEFEEVIREIKTRIAQCNGFNRKHREEVFNLLDSLRPQSTWKPSDEQKI